MAVVAANVAEVQQLYIAYFGRPGDPAGLDYWTNIVKAQGTTAAVSATFATSPEYKAAFAGMTNTQIVNKIYSNLFNRAADPTGRDYWVDLLNKGTIKVDYIVADVARAALTTDAESIENKVAAATAFTKALDTAAEIAGYSGEKALALAKAFITGVTTDASLKAALTPAALEASVAAVVAAGTPFALEGALAKLVAAQDAKSDVLADLAEDSAAVADQLDAAGVTGTPTDAEVLAAIAAIDKAGDAGMNALITGFAGLSTAQQLARIDLAKADNAEALRTQSATLDTRTKALDAVSNLGSAYKNYKAAVATEAAAAKAAGLSLTAEAKAVGDVGTLNSGKLAEVSVGGVVTSYAFTPAGGAAVELITLNTAGTAFVLATGVTDTSHKGISAALAAINKNLTAHNTLDKTREDLLNATIAADILDSADAGVRLKAVGAAFVFTKLSTGAAPTYQQILAEDKAFQTQLESRDALAGGAKGAYTTAMTALAGDVDTIMKGTAPTAADLQARLDTAVTAKLITASQATAIVGKFAATTEGTAAVNKALADVNLAAQFKTFDDARDALLLAESAETGIGTRVSQLDAAQNAVDATNAKVKALADAMVDYDAAQALNGKVDAADAAIAAARKVITDKGYAAPVTLADSVTLATAKDDVFLAGATKVSVHNFGSQGEDYLYVGAGLTYNDTEIGSGTGQTALNKAGNDKVLEFFLQQSGDNVIVHIENKAFGSTSGTSTNMTAITLVGVDLDDLAVRDGLISI